MIDATTLNAWLPVLKFAFVGGMLAGLVLLFVGIRALGRFIFPKTNVTFASDGSEHTAELPALGRYVISVVIPPLTLRVGTAHFSAQISITDPLGRPVPYRPYGRGGLFLTSVKRTDSRGRTFLALGDITCTTPGRHRLTCTTPEFLKGHELNIAPAINPLALIAAILLTILGSFLTISGLILGLIAQTNGF